MSGCVVAGWRVEYRPDGQCAGTVTSGPTGQPQPWARVPVGQVVQRARPGHVDRLGREPHDRGRVRGNPLDTANPIVYPDATGTRGPVHCGLPSASTVSRLDSRCQLSSSARTGPGRARCRPCRRRRTRSSGTRAGRQVPAEPDRVAVPRPAPLGVVPPAPDHERVIACPGSDASGRASRPARPVATVTPVPRKTSRRLTVRATRTPVDPLVGACLPRRCPGREERCVNLLSARLPAPRPPGRPRRRPHRGGSPPGRAGDPCPRSGSPRAVPRPRAPEHPLWTSQDR